MELIDGSLSLSEWSGDATSAPDGLVEGGLGAKGAASLVSVLSFQPYQAI